MVLIKHESGEDTVEPQFQGRGLWQGCADHFLLVLSFLLPVCRVQWHLGNGSL